MNTENILKHIGVVSKKIDTKVYVVGGFVRDQLLNRPHKDEIDLVVDGSGIAFGQALDEELIQAGSLVLFEDFDTARYVFVDREDENRVLLTVEFAGARKETYKEHSRKPEVVKTSLEEDLSRRDFTINAMARQVMEDGSLDEIIDQFHGQEDIHEKVLRTPLDPDVTFSDDPLRMMRAARFAAQLGFSIDKDAYDAMHRNRERLSIVSKERIQDELFRLLASPVPSVGLWILYQTKLMDQFLPEVSELAGVEEVKGYTHKDNLSHTFAVVDNIAEYSDKTLLRFAGLMHDIAKPDTKKFMRGRGWTFDMHEHLGKKMTIEICRRLRVSSTQTRYVAKLVRWHLQPIALMDDGVTDSAVRRLIVSLGDDLQDLLILCRSDVTTGNQTKKEKRLKNYDYLEKRIAEVLEKDKLRAFQSPVRGEEIMELCKLKPGPTVGKIKDAIEEAILEGLIPNEYEAAKAYFEKMKDDYVKDALEWEFNK